jgi:hypothetical protein
MVTRDGRPDPNYVRRRRRQPARPEGYPDHMFDPTEPDLDPNEIDPEGPTPDQDDDGLPTQ